MENVVTPPDESLEKRLERFWEDPEKVLRLLDLIFLYKENTIPS